jgi:hypothetical protein
MNEAFNLYITITYAAHQAGPVTEAAPQWRFYLIGWGLPVVIVTILVVIKSDSYFAKRICWFNLDYIWIFVSPCVVMILVSILTIKHDHIFVNWVQSLGHPGSDLLFFFRFRFLF